MRGSGPASSACAQADSVPAWGPEAASTVISAASAAAQPSTTSPSKSAYPGVSMTLTRWPDHSMVSSEAEIE